MKLLTSILFVLCIGCQPGNVNRTESLDGGFCVNIEEQNIDGPINYECSDISCTDVECVLDNFGVEN